MKITNLIPEIDLKKDIWVIPSSKNLPDYSLYFDFFPNNWFKESVKKITKESIENEKLSLSTIYTYNYKLKIFFEFLRQNDIILNTFDDLESNIIERYVFFLLEYYDNAASRSNSLAALKHHIRYGQILEWDNFPDVDLFDGTEFRMLQTEDSLKSMVLDDVVLNQIDSALDTLYSVSENYNDKILWGLITLVRHTGLRLSEALETTIRSLHFDLQGKNLLEVKSTKNRTERFIPVNDKVVKALKKIENITSDSRTNLGTDKLFIYFQVQKVQYSFLTQEVARIWLKKRFINVYKPKNINQEVERFTYHQFRHTIGTDLLNNGFSSFEVMEYLGHKSIHSTRLYAKVRNDHLTTEYKRLGFIGAIYESKSDVYKENNVEDENTKLMAQLPDGVCGRPIKEKVNNCIKPNACLLCPKFITTPEFLDVHRDQLQRIQEDKKRYIEENLIGTDYHLFETEEALVDIIAKLENL